MPADPEPVAFGRVDRPRQQEEANMAIVRVLLMILGIICLLFGLLWVGQGTGLVQWPPNGMMVGVSDWILRGAIVAAIGAVMLFFSRRVGRT